MADLYYFHSIKMTTLRQRIRTFKINCQPWKIYRGEISALPISAQCLFSNKGLSWDVLEMELKSEGWLLEDENLWEVISTMNGLNRKLEEVDVINDMFDDTWTDEDYEYFYNNL